MTGLPVPTRLALVLLCLGVWSATLYHRFLA